MAEKVSDDVFINDPPMEIKGPPDKHLRQKVRAFERPVAMDADWLQMDAEEVRLLQKDDHEDDDLASTTNKDSQFADVDDFDLEENPERIESDDGQSEGYEEDLVGEGPIGYSTTIVKDQGQDLSSYKCRSCNQLLKDPHQNECGHRFCMGCLQWANQQPCSGCLAEEENAIQKINKDTCIPDPATKREMMKLVVRCLAKKCRFEGKFKKYLQHDCPEARLHSSDEEGGASAIRAPITSYRQNSSSDEESHHLKGWAVPGTQMWEVKHVGWKHQRAQLNVERYIDSDAFYSKGFKPYKMCGRMYLYGDGMTKGEHMCIFLTFMKGKYDDDLAWPPKDLRVTFTLINQEGRDDIRVKLVPDPTCEMLKRPKELKGIPFGVPLFCPMRNITDPRYGFVSRDTLYLKIEVEVDLGQTA